MSDNQALKSSNKAKDQLIGSFFKQKKWLEKSGNDDEQDQVTANISSFSDVIAIHRKQGSVSYSYYF